MSLAVRLLWGSQSWLQPPFRRLPGTERCEQAPAERRRQPGLAAPLVIFCRETAVQRGGHRSLTVAARMEDSIRAATVRERFRRCPQ